MSKIGIYAFALAMVLSLVASFNAQAGGGRPHQIPVAGVALIVLGVLLLLHTLRLLDFEYVARYWPVLLILAGAYLLWLRFSGHGAPKEMPHEHQ